QQRIQKRDQMIGQPIDSSWLKDVCVVLKHQAELVLRFTKRDLQIYGRRLAINAKNCKFKPRQTNLAFRHTRGRLHRTFRTDVQIFHLVQGHPAHVSLYFELVNQMPEWILLVRKSIKTCCPYPVQNLKKRWIAEKVGAQHECVQHVADEIGCFFRVSISRNGSSYHEIFLSRVAPQKDIQCRQ